MKRPEISIIIPVYNTSEYLEQCISSIVNQTFKDIEIICVDDGSTDNCLGLLKKFADQDSRIFIIHREQKSGSAAVPRNLGMSYAKGKYIIFLDSDDYFEHEMLEKMYNCAEEKNADLVMCDNYVVSSVDGLVKDFEGELHHKYIFQHDVFSYKDIPDRIFQISNAAIWHKLILRDLLVDYQLNFQENVPILDDIYFVNLLLVLSKRIYILDEKLVYYRKARPGGQTTAIEKNKESIYLAFKELNKYLVENKIYDEVKVSLQNWMLVTLEWWFYSIKKREIAEELFGLYKKDYFKELGLVGLDDSDIGVSNKAFYSYINNEKYRVSVPVILNEVSPDGVDLVLYGAGKLGKNTYKFIASEEIHTIKLWCDINADKMRNPMIQNPQKIKEVKYDLLIIAIAKESIVLEVKDYLNTLGVDRNKIYTI